MQIEKFHILKSNIKCSCDLYMAESNKYHGFFCVLIHYLEAISNMIKRDIQINNISYENAWQKYTQNGTQLYNTIFKYNPNNVNMLYEKYKNAKPIKGSHEHFRNNNLNFGCDIIQTFFSDSNLIQEKFKNFIIKTHIDLNNTLAVYYRSTDKITELPSPNILHYIDLIKNALNKTPNLKILFQSDSLNTTELIKKQFPNTIINENLYRTNTKNGVHFILKNEELINDIVELYSMISIMSQCKFLICNCSFVSTYMIYKRGTENGVIQFEENGSLIQTQL